MARTLVGVTSGIIQNGNVGYLMLLCQVFMAISIMSIVIFGCSGCGEGEKEKGEGENTEEKKDEKKIEIECGCWGDCPCYDEFCGSCQAAVCGYGDGGVSGGGGDGGGGDGGGGDGGGCGGGGCGGG